MSRVRHSPLPKLRTPSSTRQRSGAVEKPVARTGPSKARDTQGAPRDAKKELRLSGELDAASRQASHAQLNRPGTVIYDVKPDSRSGDPTDLGWRLRRVMSQDLQFHQGDRRLFDADAVLSALRGSKNGVVVSSFGYGLHDARQLKSTQKLGSLAELERFVERTWLQGGIDRAYARDVRFLTPGGANAPDVLAALEAGKPVHVQEWVQGFRDDLKPGRRLELASLADLRQYVLENDLA